MSSVNSAGLSAAVEKSVRRAGHLTQGDDTRQTQ